MSALVDALLEELGRRKVGGGMMTDFPNEELEGDGRVTRWTDRSGIRRGTHTARDGGEGSHSSGPSSELTTSPQGRVAPDSLLATRPTPLERTA